MPVFGITVDLFHKKIKLWQTVKKTLTNQIGTGSVFQKIMKCGIGAKVWRFCGRIKESGKASRLIRKRCGSVFEREVKGFNEIQNHIII